MSKELKLYKAFIDGLVERKDSMTARWVKGDGFPQTDDNKAKNDLFAALTPAQREVLAEILQDEHIAGIHDALAYINEVSLPSALVVRLAAVPEPPWASRVMV